MRHPLFIRSALALAAIAVSALTQASTGYTAAATVTGQYLGWTAMNNYGDLAGYSATYIGGQLQYQPSGGGDYSWADYYIASAINDKGIVGGTIGSRYGSYGVYSSQAHTTLLTPFNAWGASSASVDALNSHGMGAGTSNTDHLISLHDGIPYWGTHAFRTDGTTLSDLGTLGGYNSAANGINNKGEVVGWAELSNGVSHSFVVTQGKMVDIGGIEGSNYNQAIDINDAGLIIGNANIGLYPHSQAYVYENGSAKLIDTPKGFESSTKAVNNWGQVVGKMWDSSYHKYGFMYVNGQVIKLDTLLDPALGWSVEDALDINDRGQILTLACKGNSCFNMILTPDVLQEIPPIPVPEPETYTMLLAGLGLLGWASRRKHQAK